MLKRNQFFCQAPAFCKGSKIFFAADYAHAAAVISAHTALPHKRKLDFICSQSQPKFFLVFKNPERGCRNFFLLVKLLLNSFVLNDPQGCSSREYFFSFFFKLFESIYIDVFNFKSDNICFFAEFVNCFKVHQIALLEKIGCNPAGSLCTRVENPRPDIPFSGFIEHHFSELAAAQDSERERRRKVIHSHLKIYFFS